MNTITIPRIPRLIAVAVAFVLSLGMILASMALMPNVARADTAPLDPANPATPTTVSADALPTTQIDGVAWSQVVVGDTVYVAGKFNTARPAGSAPGVNTVVRNNLLAYNINTGNLITSFAPSLNAQALGIAASPDGSRVYVVGDFTSIDGAGYYRAAAFSTATGAIIPSFRPILESQGRAVVATDTAVYLSGTFSSVNGQPRGYVAKINASDGSVADWNPNADSTIGALALTPDGSKLVMGGRFKNIGGTPNLGLGAADAATGAVLPWAANQSVRNAGTRASITSLYASNDRIYGTGYVFGSTADGNLEGAFSADPDTGNVQWVEDCHGDSYSVFELGDAVYVAGHPHFCGNVDGFPETTPRSYNHTIAFSKAATGVITPDTLGEPYFNWGGTARPSLLNWFPAYVTGTYTGQGQAAWSLAGNSDYLVVGGEFPYVNGVAQAGLTRFAVSSIAPNKMGPNINTALVPTVASFKAGEVRVSWTSTFDRDNKNLTYSLVRDKSSNVDPIYTTTQESTFWQRANMGFIDKGLTPGSVHTYRIFVTDPFGNSVSRLSASVTVASTGGNDTYATSVEASNPSSYWPLDEPSGAAAFDHSGFNDLVVGSGVSRGDQGPAPMNPASVFDGTSTGIAATKTAVPGPDTFTTEAWVKTTSTSGGKIIGFGGAASGNSSSYDRMVYMTDSGQIYFGVYPGGVKTVSSSTSFNDGQWHHVVASLGADGMRLYVDGKVVGSRSDVTAGQAYNGYWRIGGDNLNGWPARPSSNYLNGSIGQVAVYPTVLSRQDVISHFVASGRTSPIAAVPADAYGAAVYNKDPLLYWRLGESSGAAAADSGQQENPGTYAGGVIQGVSGALSEVTNSAATFGAGAGVSSNTQFTNPTTYSLEAWFNTTTSVGGKLIGFGNAQTGQSSNYDRHVYMQDDGTLVFGTYTGQLNTITTSSPYNDGKWHYVVATQSNNGMELYVDGTLIGTDPQTSAQDYSGYWRVGGDTTWGSSSPWFDGKLDEIAVYPTALNAQDVADHYSLGISGQLPNVLPTAAFTSTGNRLDVTFDASSSADSDGTIASYSWDFGDGQTGSGATPTHRYALPGTYVVSLTVTDNRGGTATETSSVIATAPNQAPTAGFTSTIENLDAAFDASSSADSDGSIASYTWDFGDGQVGSGISATHSYATGGTFNATLTVTDNEGATDSRTQSVIAVAPNQAPTASFLAPVENLTGSFDATASSDPDGSITAYAWDFGDGDTGTGSTATHSYSVPGSYLVTLVVTDNQGATGTLTQSVTVSAANTSPTAEFSSVATGLSVAFDASASADSDGTISSYVWDFGDGQTGSGVSATHAYAASGTFTATLTISDDKGATAVISHPVTVVSANAPPTAEFTSGVTDLSASFDASTSTDSDGTIATYAWDFGDTLSGTGVTPTHVYATAGTYSVSLTVTDDGGAVTTITHPVTVARANVSPTAAFSSTVSDLAASFTGTTSTDPDGTIASYAWNFGDTLTGTGATVSHSYTAAGTYTVSLTVTDNLGATNTISQPVTVTTAPSSAVAKDAFGRTVTGGWGSADQGGPWTITGNASNLSVGSGVGQIAIAAGSTRSAVLGSVSSTDTDVTVTMSLNALPTGNGSYTDVIGRKVGSSVYIGKVWIRPNGTVFSALQQGLAFLKIAQVPGLTYTAGSQLSVRVQTTGTSPTTLRMKIWATGQPEPTAWLTSATDTTAALQTAGAVGLQSSVSGSATAGVTTSFDNFGVNVGTTTPPANQSPRAAFTSTTSGLTASFTGATSTDVDGTISSYEWSYGDGTTGTGVTSGRSYAAAGTYTVSLTVTDNLGATNTITHPITVTTPPPANVLAQANFGTETVNGWGTAEVGGGWTNSGASDAYRVAEGVGQQIGAPRSTKTSSLAGISATSTDLTVSFTTDKVATGGGIFISALGREVGSTNYQARAWVQANGAVQLQLLQGGSALQLVNVAGITYTPGTVMQLRLQVFGTNPTTIRAKIWTSAQTEPADWMASVTDTTSALQAAGSIGLRTYLSGTATNSPVTTRFDNLLVITQQ